MKNEVREIKGIDPKNEASASRARRILVVEDDVEVSRAVAQMLDQLGYLSVPCSHAEKALGHIQSQKFDLMLVDYRMPDMTGLDLILMLKQDGCKIPAIMMTGYSATEDRMLSEKFNGIAILKKPITIPQLAKAVEEFLKETT
jgi:DNA-binding NtrC family response regulator